MELCRASDVMTSSPDMIYSQENVAKLAKMLLRTGHSGFPVVKYDEETRTEVAYGLITRPVQISVFAGLKRSVGNRRRRMGRWVWGVISLLTRDAVWGEEVLGAVSAS